MLNVLRRGPASAATATSLFSTSLCSQCIRTVRPRAVRQSIAPLPYLSITRAFGASSQWQRTATAHATYEDEAVEGELEQEVHAQRPPSDGQINQASQRGEVTKFKELAERGLVCPTVVNTITRDMGLETMTQVQSLTINKSLKGTDM